MKKILLISSFLLGGFLLAQTSFANNYSISELENIQKTVPKEQKHDFYKQYFRAKLVSDMKSRFTHKNYSEEILRKFTDSVIAGNTSSEAPTSTNNVAFVPTETYEQFIASHNHFISQTEDAVRSIYQKELQGLMIGKNQDKEKLIAELINIEMAQIKDARGKSPEVLKKQYEEQILSEKVIYDNDPSTSRGINKIISKIDDNFTNNLQETGENYDLLVQNMGSYPGQSFPVVTSGPEEGAIYESVPGEILTYVTENGFAAGRHYYSYKIEGNNLKLISLIPDDRDLNLEKKVSKYTKRNWRFEGRAGYDIEKTKNGEYIITTSLYKEEDAACCPSMALEYKTKDFKNFIPLRISKVENTWITIK